MKRTLSYTIRPCETRKELAGCVDLQEAIWGYAAHELYPLRLFITLPKIGGQVLGAFAPDEELVGFVASMPAWNGRSRYYHSLSLGVLPAHENQGLGRALKLRQRKEALKAGIDRIEWTFDPMRAKNAFFNIERLGAIACRYLPDHYGQVQSRLQQGLPSDRLVAEWWLKSRRVKRALASKPIRRKNTAVVAEVSIPPEFASLVESHPGGARKLQSAARRELQTCFARKLAITGFVIDGSAGRYILERLGRTRARTGAE